uniref:OVATE domain-containing protein n=1 Tax=Picea sitchensis TaxID=3332 RepID=A9P1X2_PICSI|nr:unknown [Picea sitchensis]
MEKKHPGISNVQGLTLEILRRRRCRGADDAKAKKSSDGEENEKKFTLLCQARSRIISGVKRILRRVENSRGVETIKDFLLGSYQRLPKPSSFQLFSCREPKVHGSRRKHRSFSFYSDVDGSYFWTREDDHNSQADCTPKKDLDRFGQKMAGSFLYSGHHDQRSRQYLNSSSSVAAARSRAEIRSVIEKKLREILMERNISLEDVFDIEEFLRCYSRLTSPFYIDMVNQFLMDACGEFVEMLNE